MIILNEMEWNCRRGMLRLTHVFFIGKDEVSPVSAEPLDVPRNESNAKKELQIANPSSLPVEGIRASQKGMSFRLVLFGGFESGGF